MIHILTNTGEIDQPWARRHLEKVLQPGMKAVIAAMSDFEAEQNDAAWHKNYGPGGLWRNGYQKPLERYGIRNIVWLNPFADDSGWMRQELLSADIIVLPGGAPDQLMKQLKKFRLKKAVLQAPILLGISAGAMVQLTDYHITPDDDYPDFSWHKGLGLLPFDVECHYTNSAHQNRHVQRALEEKGLETYCLYEDGGLLVQDGQVTCMGKVDIACRLR